MLADKHIIRIDLDLNLERDCLRRRYQRRLKKGQAKGTGLLFRMEMSGFVRIPGNIPIISDIETVWSILALKVAEKPDIGLDLISHNQSTEKGRKMRKCIVDKVRPVDRKLVSNYSNN